MRYRIRAACCALLLGAAAIPAYAQAVLLGSVPAPGTSVPAGDVAFHLRFNVPIDHVWSRLALMRPDGSNVGSYRMQVCGATFTAPDGELPSDRPKHSTLAKELNPVR